MDAYSKTMGKDSEQLHTTTLIVIGVATVIVLVFFSIARKSFLTPTNLLEVAMRSAIDTPLALGVMLSLIVRGIDLSSGTTMGLVGIVVLSALHLHIPLWVAVLMTLPVVLLIGLIDGTLIAGLNMNPFIVTLAVMFIGNSIEKLVTNGGLPIYAYGEQSGLSNIYRASVGGVPVLLVTWVVVILMMFIVLERATVGRRLYGAGLSVGAAENVGVRVRFYYGGAYVFSALLGSISGIAVASQIRSAQPLVGQSYLWDAIGAAYLSTVLSATRRPNLFGTIFGVCLLALVANGLTLLGLAFYWKDFSKGLVILFVLLASAINARRGD